MSHRRLVIPKECVTGHIARLKGPLHHYLCHVLRIAVHEKVLCILDSGGLWSGRIAQISKTEVVIELGPSHRPSPDLSPKIGLIYGLSRRTRTEWVLQKSTELAVDWIQPALCERSVARPENEDQKLNRWKSIIAHACQQSGRSSLPELRTIKPLSNALHNAIKADARYLATWEGVSLIEIQPQIVAASQEIVLAVGPEGGFSLQEMILAKEEGFILVNLGSLTLRTETAALTLVALVSFLSGHL